MKRQINILITVFFLLSLHANAQWIREKSPTNKKLNSISCADSSVAWIAGDKGTLLFMKGNEWKLYSGPTAKDLYCVDMINEGDGWAVGADGAIIHYNGSDWENVESPTINDLYSVNFSDNKKGIAVGENGIILNYNGTGWYVSGEKIKGNLFSTQYYGNDIWIGGGRECENVPIVRLSSNGKGIIRTTGTQATISGIDMVSPDDGWAVGSPSTIMHFDGSSWTKPDIGFGFPSLRALCFAGKGTGISVGYGGTILSCSNNEWKPEESGTQKNLNSVAFVNNCYYVVGDSGIILVKKTSQEKAVRAIEEDIKNNLEVYPNPCDDLLNATIPAGEKYARCLISVKNRSGQTILQKEFVAADVNTIYSISTRKYSNGFYILEIISGGKRYSAKFIVEH